MPFMRITLGQDGFWHCDLVRIMRPECHYPLTDKSIYIGGAGKDVMPEPPRHEMCPICMPIRTPRGNLPGAEIRQLFQMGFQEDDKLHGPKGEIVLTNPDSPFMEQVWVLLHGPTTIGERWYDAREGFDLRVFHQWWERVSHDRTTSWLKGVDNRSKLG